MAFSTFARSSLCSNTEYMVDWFDRLGDANIQAQDDEMMRLMEDVRKKELHAATLRLYDAMESVMVEVHTTKV